MTSAVPEERPVCTIKKCGPVPVTQHLYRCKTCHFSPWETMCESCAKFCHKTHQLEDLGYRIGYCHCGYGCSKCHCFCEHPVEGDLTLPADCPRQCNFRETGTRYAVMDTYQCPHCGLIGSRVACQACSFMCHRDHGSSFRSHSSSAYCDCGDPSQSYHCLLAPPTELPEPIPCCTFHLTGDKSYIRQKSYHCNTCGGPANHTICPSCAKACHAGHELVETSYETYFCDCGAGALPCTCKLMEELEPAQ